MRVRHILIGGKRELEGQVTSSLGPLPNWGPLSTGRMRKNEGNVSPDGRRTDAGCEKR